MEMHQIRYFLAVCSERNFTRAARHCHVSQPSLTRAIKLLEAEFGGFLFRREHPHSHLTELGEIVRPHLQQVWEQSFAAIAQAQEFTAVGRTRLRVGILCTIAPRLLVDLTARLQTLLDPVELEIIDGAARDLEEQLASGHIAAAIYGKPDKSDSRFARTPLFRERMMIAVSRHHRLAGHAAIRFADLAGERRIRRSRCEYNELFARFLSQHRIDCEIAFDCARDDWALALIARGLGFTLMPQHCVDHPDIVARPLAAPALWREIGLFTFRERLNSESLDAFVRETMQMTTAAAGE